MSTCILVVDDDAALAEMIGLVLKPEGYRVEFCADGASAVPTFERVHPDLILLDVMLPKVDGIEICRRIREKSDVPIIMLTARSDTRDVVLGLEAGADDYIAKPFKPRELVARIKARIRTREQALPEQIELGPLAIDTLAHRVTKLGVELSLTPLEFDLLALLASNPHKAFDRIELLEKVWGYRHNADTRLVNVHVQRLRSKIEDDPDNPNLIVTVRRVGYRANFES